MRRSIKEYVKGLKKQVAEEQAQLDRMRAAVSAQAAKVEALTAVVAQLSPPPPARKEKTHEQ